MQKKKKKSCHWWMCTKFQRLSFLLVLLINANISKIPPNIHKCSGWELSYSSVTTRNWLWIQEFNGSQWKHSVRLSWLCGIYRKEYCISHYLERRCCTFLTLLTSLNLCYSCASSTFFRELVVKHLLVSRCLRQALSRVPGTYDRCSLLTDLNSWQK